MRSKKHEERTKETKQTKWTKPQIDKMNQQTINLDRYGVRQIASIFLWVPALGILFFSSAGRTDWIGAWVYLGIHLFGFLFVLSVGMIWRRSQLIELLNQRGRGRRKDTKGFDKVITALMMPIVPALPVIAGLDIRYEWAVLPEALIGVGVLVFLSGFFLIEWALFTNAHFETTVRIQTDRNHKVVTDGPYRLVRHPGYVGASIMYLAAPVILGAAWAFVPAGLMIFLFIIRAGLEDHTLKKELTGYEEYSRRTRYRLIPGVW